MKYNDHPDENALEIMVAKDRPDLLKTFTGNFDTQEKNLDYIYSSLEHSKFNNFKDNKLLWNIAGYITIISFDLKIIGKDITFSTNKWEKRHYCRQASIVMFEAINDLFILLGKDFIELTKNRLDISELEDELKSIRILLNKFKDLHYLNLQKIRNISAAHRDTDVMLLNETIHEINAFEFISIISNFDGIINQLGAFTIKLINKGIDLPEIKHKN